VATEPQQAAEGARGTHGFPVASEVSKRCDCLLLGWSFK